MRNGQLSNRFASANPQIRGKPGETPGCSWRRSFGSYAPVRNGAELPDEFGKWNSVFKRFRRWVKADTFYHMFKALTTDADLEYAMIDGTIVKVHRSGQGAKGGLFARPLGAREGA